ncbi:mitochondrial ribosomal protein L46 isoform X2 [Arctopsyche grandis]|uniref:mitochondrial ribosomal protein L46 isoform X2 n=1 Tax=Arctopsyche grandis TaxID=121162 RepID=UPI00406D6C30
MLCRAARGPLTGARLVLRPLTTDKSLEKDRWDILASVCLERLPIVTPSLNDTELKYKKFLENIETNQSFKSDHELRHEKEIFAKNIKENQSDTGVSIVTAQDFEDASTDELSNFKFPSITTADKKNDQKSLERKLQSHLVLLVEQQLGDKKKFILPQGKHQNGETLRQTAERVFKEACGEDLNVQFYGNAPCGYHRYTFKTKEGSVGAKVFFYYARHISGQISKDRQYKWLTRNELQSVLPEKYHTSVSNFLVEERS